MLMMGKWRKCVNQPDRGVVSMEGRKPERVETPRSHKRGVSLAEERSHSVLCPSSRDSREHSHCHENEFLLPASSTQQ